MDRRRFLKDAAQAGSGLTLNGSFLSPKKFLYTVNPKVRLSQSGRLPRLSHRRAQSALLRSARTGVWPDRRASLYARPSISW